MVKETAYMNVPLRMVWILIPVFFLKNSMDKGSWPATVHGVTKNQM